MMLGPVHSTDGNVTGWHGGFDFWLIKMGSGGNLLWQKCFGGPGDDMGIDMCETSDGNYILAGTAGSNGGTVAGNHGNYDAWVVKTDTSGNLIWKKCLGGSNQDGGRSIRPTSDGGFILVGTVMSTDGNVTGNHGANDIWVVKLNPAGDLMWQKCLGGSADDFGYCGIQTSEGGYLISGTTLSNDGDVTGLHGNQDAWVVKLDVSGNIVWQRCLGGSQDDGGGTLQQAPDGGYIMLGYTNSNNGDVSGNHSSPDFWLVKLNQAGNLMWQKCLGSYCDDYPRSLQLTPDGGYLCAGYANCSTGDVTGNHGGEDGWIVKLDSLRNIQWQKCLGGSSTDEARNIQFTADGGYFITGFTFSNDGDVSGNHGQSDVWGVKLSGTLTNPVFNPAADSSSWSEYSGPPLNWMVLGRYFCAAAGLPDAKRTIAVRSSKIVRFMIGKE